MFFMNKLLLLVLWFVPMFLSAQTSVTIEAASPDPTLVVRGKEKQLIVYNDESWKTQNNAVMLLPSSAFSQVISSNKTYVAVSIDKDMKVTDVLNGVTKNTDIPSFSETLNMQVSTGGFLLIALDSEYKTGGCRKFLAENFHVGDIVKLRVNGDIQSLEGVLALSGKEACRIVLDNDAWFTVNSNKTQLTGSIENYKSQSGVQLFVVRDGSHQQAATVSDGKFSIDLSLNPGANYFDIILKSGNLNIAEQAVVVYSKISSVNQSELVMWVEQFPNAKVLTNRKAVKALVDNVKRAGFTSIGLDVKGPEGYVSYRKNDLSKTPYFTATKNQAKQVKDDGFDLLEVVLEEAHKVGLKVYTSFNFFTEGNITTNDYAVLHQHKDWEEVVQRPEDKGRLLRISETVRGKDAAAGKLLALAFVNPSNMDVQNFQLLRVEEVLKNYDVDGIVLDRCRYDNLYADFSDVSKKAFEQYLKKDGKTLQCFPDDAFKIDEKGTLVKGKLFKEWICFRSQTIADFTSRIRSLVNKYKSEKNSNLKMAAYVGSWYEVYYQNGVNWASDKFVYNDRLAFPESNIYGSKYNETSYLKNLDFLMIGTYYKTPKEVNKYLTLGNILTCGQVPLIGSMSLPDLSVVDQGKVFGASLTNSSGLMIFDYCYVDWKTFEEQMKIAFSIMNK